MNILRHSTPVYDDDYRVTIRENHKKEHLCIFRAGGVFPFESIYPWVSNLDMVYKDIFIMTGFKMNMLDVSTRETDCSTTDASIPTSP